jgi:cobalt-zinc-cadmium efflux system membrane fusion protein
MKAFHLYITAFVFTLFSCGTATEKAQEHSVSGKIKLSEEQIRSNGIAIGKLTQKELALRLPCNGMIEVPPQNKASVHSPVKGFVKEILVIQGDHVHVGDVLFSIEYPEFARLQREMLESDAKMTFLFNEFERKKMLRKEDAASIRELEIAESDWKSEKAKLEGLKAELKASGFSVEQILQSGKIQNAIAIRAPFNGEVSALHVNLGKLVNPEDLLAELVNTEHLHMELRVFARDIAMVKEGQSIEFSVGGIDSVYKGTVYLVGAVVDPANNTVMVHAHIDSPGKFTAGVYTQATILAGSHQALVIPKGGLIKIADEHFVFRQTPDGFEKIKVDIGPEDAAYTEIHLPDGVSASDVFVTAGAYYLNEVPEEEGH